jgi:uncharacterized membrane protein YdfJ with MMPL/SSD domain
MPVMMFAILFGLSMDYEVFLVSRIREEDLKVGDTSGAVAVQFDVRPTSDDDHELENVRFVGGPGIP